MYFIRVIFFSAMTGAGIGLFIGAVIQADDRAKSRRTTQFPSTYVNCMFGGEQWQGREYFDDKGVRTLDCSRP